METIPDQLESCRYDVCVQKQLKFGMIKGVSFFKFMLFELHVLFTIFMVLPHIELMFK
jgi:hypothetical protein